MRFNITDEYSSLKSVILGTAEEFYQGEKINLGMDKYYGTSQAPTPTGLNLELQQLRLCLETSGVQVLSPAPSKEVPQQLAPRDIGFVIGDTFVFSNMTRVSRKNEARFIKDILQNFTGSNLQTPDDVFLEGGNVMLDGEKLFVGIGLRTTESAVDFLETSFGDKYRVIPVRLSSKEEILHLDAVLNIFGEGKAVCYEDGIMDLPSELSDYKLLKITKEEKELGGCNFLCIDQKTILTRDGLPRLYDYFKSQGYGVYSVGWDELKKTGIVGPRCATLPLIRLS